MNTAGTGHDRIVCARRAVILSNEINSLRILVRWDWVKIEVE